MSAVFRRLLCALSVLVLSSGANDGASMASSKTLSRAIRGATGADLVSLSRGVSANSNTTSSPHNALSVWVIFWAYWLRTQSILNRFATCNVILSGSVVTVATRGRIHVLNCCSGMCCAKASTHFAQISGSKGARMAGTKGAFDIKKRMARRRQPVKSANAPVVDSLKKRRLDCSPTRKLSTSILSRRGPATIAINPLVFRQNIR